jgi:hypothetical protein
MKAAYGQVAIVLRGIRLLVAGEQFGQFGRGLDFKEGFVEE